MGSGVRKKNSPYKIDGVWQYNRDGSITSFNVDPRYRQWLTDNHITYKDGQIRYPDRFLSTSMSLYWREYNLSGRKHSSIGNYTPITAVSHHKMSSDGKVSHVSTKSTGRTDIVASLKGAPRFPNR